LIYCIQGSFFNLSGGDKDISLETLHHRSILEVVQRSKSGSQVGLRRVVDFEAIPLKVPQEVC
jgi:hypothetical protein